MKFTFQHLHLIVSDLEKSIAFFTDILGATLETRKMYGSASGASLKLGETNIVFRVNREGETMTGDSTLPRFGYDHIGLQVDDVDSLYEELKEKGIHFVVPPTDFEKLRIAFFKGPDNITIEILSIKDPV